MRYPSYCIKTIGNAITNSPPNPNIHATCSFGCILARGRFLLIDINSYSTQRQCSYLRRLWNYSHISLASTSQLSRSFGSVSFSKWQRSQYMYKVLFIDLFLAIKTHIAQFILIQLIDSQAPIRLASYPVGRYYLSEI